MRLSRANSTTTPVVAPPEGVLSMKVGGKRRLVVPPHLGYGAQGTKWHTSVANSTLHFECELMAIRPAPQGFFDKIASFFS